MGLYDRQETIKLIQNQSICVVGCGGIGYWVAKYAAMSGIETIYLYDADVIEENNLNRLDLPLSAIGANKAFVVRTVINEIRPLASVVAFPFRLSEGNLMKADWLIDCTDNIKSQSIHQELAKQKGMKYVKAGYNGEHISLNNEVAEWGTETNGYTIVPSWVVPATIIAAFTIAKVMKYQEKELSAYISDYLK